MCGGGLGWGLRKLNELNVFQMNTIVTLKGKEKKKLKKTRTSPTDSQARSWVALGQRLGESCRHSKLFEWMFL